MNKYSETEYEIFSRLFILKEFSEENIKKLSKLKVSVIGVGGIGCPLVHYLVSSGIKELILVDGDIVEKNNLNRQILFNINNLGEKKVNAAKEKLHLINPKCKITTLETNINRKNLNYLSESSLIIDATDNWETSKLLNEYCVNNTINFLYASVTRHDIQIILFDNSRKNDHLCLNCIFPNNNDVDLPRCETVGISGISAGLAGLISAQKIINFSLNLGNENNILTLCDGKKLTIENIVVKSKHECDLKLR
tara:strand:+ start:287 stop:1039 length:753 start_codon:yes stop_codon:yes gene_type:complete